MDIFILNRIHKIFWWKEACQYLFNDDFHIQSSPNVTEICKLKCWALCWIIGYWNLNVTTTYLLTTLVLLPFPPIFWTFFSDSAKELNTESWVWLAPALVLCPPLCPHLSLTWNMCYSVTSLLHSSSQRLYRIISQDVITSSSKQNECSSKWFENTVPTNAMILITIWSTKVAAQLFSLSNFVFKNILFSSLNLILSDEKWSNECSHFCWRHLGSETQEEGAPRDIPLIQISHFSTY